MRILVTGGAGFVGSHLVDALIARGHTVRVLDNLEPQVHGGNQSVPAYVHPEADLRWGDMRDAAAVEEALEDVDAVFHQASAVGVGQSMYRVRHYMEANVVGTAVLLEAVSRRRGQLSKLVVASSMSIYGEGRYQTPSGQRVAPGLRPASQFREGLWELRSPQGDGILVPFPTDEGKPLSPTSPYAISKRDQEELCLTLGRAYGIPTVALRYFNVYGERQSLSNPYTGIAAIFASRVLNGNPPLVFEDGLQTRDFVHVSDIVQANLLALSCDDMDNDSFNVGTGRRLTVLEIATEVVRNLADGSMAEELEPVLVGKYREGDVRHCYADITKIQRVAGYSPTVRFEDGIGGFLAWCRTQQAEDRVEQATQELEAQGLTK